MIRPISINTINFKGKYSIMVPKSAFSEPNNLEKCENDFDCALASQLYSSFSFFRNKSKYMSFLEAPNYASTINSTSYGIHWIKSHTGVNIEEPKNPDYHSFVVITKDENKKMSNKLKPKNMKSIENSINEEAQKRKEEGLPADDVWMQAVCYKYFSNILKESTENSDVDEVIILDSLDNINFAISEMDI